MLTAAALLFTMFADPALPQERVDPSAPAIQMLERPHVGKFEEPGVGPGKTVVAVELAWSRRERAEVTRRLAGTIEAMLGKEAAGRLTKDAYEGLGRAVAGEDAGSWVRLAETPILVRYDARYDEIRVLHEELDLIETPADAPDVGRVRDAAERFLKRLDESGVIDPRLYHQAAMQVGYKRVGEGPVEQGQARPGRIVGYRVTYRPRLHGFQLANAGLRLGIAASGEVSSVRLGGVTPTGEWREGMPGPRGTARGARAGVKDLIARLHRASPKDAEQRIAWSRVMYVMPETASRAVVEPMLVVSFTQVRQTENGPVASRRKTLAYSLTDPKAPPIDFDAPAARHEGIEVTRGR